MLDVLKLRSRAFRVGELPGGPSTILVARLERGREWDEPKQPAAKPGGLAVSLRIEKDVRGDGSYIAVASAR